METINLEDNVSSDNINKNNDIVITTDISDKNNNVTKDSDNKFISKETNIKPIESNKVSKINSNKVD